jgi:nickel-type superoxide dismutase maturation protease
VLGGAGLVVGAMTRWVAVPWAVGGSSMSPTLEDGDRVIVELLPYRRHLPRVGDVVLLEGPEGMALVKRIASVDPRGSVWVLGDNPAESADSRTFGSIPLHRVRGRITWRYWPPSGWGSIE